MHLEADIDVQRACIVSTCGRCSLAIGSADADELKDTLSVVIKHVLSSKEAVEAHTALVMGVSFLGGCIRVMADPPYICPSHVLL
jgi:hypothetical protein